MLLKRRRNSELCQSTMLIEERGQVIKVWYVATVGKTQ